jgi:N-glycosylase/DNA lyase
MQQLLKQIHNIPIDVKTQVEKKLKHFSGFKHKHTNEWFSELCFCLLTANSKATTAIHIQKELGADGFINASATIIKQTIRKNKHRFHNNKTKFIITARKHIDIKQKLAKLNETEKREFLVQNIKGIGYKESSHYLRNTGHFNLAILDRHVLNLMLEHSLIKEKPKTLTKNRYLELEKKLKNICDKLSLSQAQLDFYLWYLKTGKVLK